MATGNFLGSSEYPLENITLDNVRVKQGIPPIMARRPISETFPATKLPVIDPYVPPEYATTIQKRIAGLYGWIVHSIVTVGSFIQRIVEQMHLALVWRVMQTEEVQTWYLSYLGQAFLNTVWVWIAMALGFATAGVFSSRGWVRYRKMRKARVEEAAAAAAAAAAAVAADTTGEDDGIEDTAGAVELAEDERVVSHSESLESSWNNDNLSLHPPRVETRYPPILCHLGYITLIFLCWGGAFYTGTFPFRKPMWQRTYRYYACRSVVNGIAKGNTWPVPSCFKKERSPWWPGGGGGEEEDDDDDNNSHPHHHRRHRHGSNHWSPHKVTIDTSRIVITACLALLIVAVALFNHWREQQGNRNRRRRQGLNDNENGDSNAGVPEYSPIPSFVSFPEDSHNNPLIDPLEDDDVVDDVDNYAMNNE
jgi:hypothetical protein